MLAAVGGLIVLVGSGVLAELYQGRPHDTVEDFPALVDLGDQAYDRGATLWQQGDREQALRAFTAAAGYYGRALAVRPGDNDVRVALAEVYLYQGELAGDVKSMERAFDTVQEALALEPDKPEALLLLGYYYLALGQTQSAVSVWQRVVEVAPGTPQSEEAQRLVGEYGPP